MTEHEAATALNALPEVRAQYEAYPYPPRDPADEARQLITTELDFLDQLNHYGYAGRAGFDRGFRALVAGGGTGDATIFLAEQLRGRDAEVVHLDISDASLAIARRRAEARGLTNITFVHDSLLDLAHGRHGRFDYVNCSGVLHHLADPDAGLAALTAVLAPRGVLGIMLYGRIGRFGIYQAQDMLRLMHADRDLSADERLGDARALLAALGPDHWFRRTQLKSADLSELGDAGLHDLLLHAQDRGYTVPEIYALLDAQALHLATFVAFPGRARRLFSPRSYTQDPRLLARLDALTERQRQAWCEMMHANLRKHSFYAVREPVVPPDPADADMVPFFSLFFARQDDDGIYRRVAEAVRGSAGPDVELSADGARVQFPRTPGAVSFFRHLDGRRTIGEIAARMRMDLAAGGQAPPPGSAEAEAQRLYTLLHQHDWLFLRHRDVVPPRSLREMQLRSGA